MRAEGRHRQLLDPEPTPDGTRVRAAGAFVYYRSVGALAEERIRPYPKDLRIISDDFHYHYGSDRGVSDRPVDCRRFGSRIRLTNVFPACWNGRDLDSPDHRSHMAFPTARGCPETHPVALPRLAVRSST